MVSYCYDTIYVVSHFFIFNLINDLHHSPILLYENALQKAFSCAKGAKFFEKKLIGRCPHPKIVFKNLPEALEGLFFEKMYKDT
jgi:hypothetical protein